MITCTYIYIYICVCVSDMSMYFSVYACVHKKYVYMHVCVYMCMCIIAYIYILYICIDRYIHVCLCLHIHTDAHHLYAELFVAYSKYEKYKASHPRNQKPNSSSHKSETPFCQPRPPNLKRFRVEGLGFRGQGFGEPLYPPVFRVEGNPKPKS